MQYEYKTKGTCSQRILFEIEDGKLRNVQYLGGCHGNLQGISKLAFPVRKHFTNMMRMI